jgi:hypothetical protein
VQADAGGGLAPEMSTAWRSSPAAAKGLPNYVEDPATIARVVRLILAVGPLSGPPDDSMREGSKTLRP